MAAWLTWRVGGYRGLGRDEAIGLLVSEHASAGFSDQRDTQIRAWTETLQIADDLCSALLSDRPGSGEWGLLLEFEIPRRRRRPDLILLAGEIIFVIEVKTGARDFDSAARWQVEEYALDLRDFHAESQGRRIVPILLATEATEWRAEPLGAVPGAGRSFVAPVQSTGVADLARCILSLEAQLQLDSGHPLDLDVWDKAPYRPTLSIIEAAEELYAGHGVSEISHAYADNLGGTVEALINAIRTAQQQSQRVICFVTGVPGSGKTLAGLSAVHDPALRQGDRPPGVFLSGNGPLVRIVRAALARDAVNRNEAATKREAERQVSAFIQNVHAFIEEHAFHDPDRPPPENVIIFDEAQRAWDQEKIDSKRRTQRKGAAGRSEAELILEVMERCDGWSAIIALVGGGQEIHTGEAGLSEWGRALQNRPTPWSAIASPAVLPRAPERSGGGLLDRVEEGAVTVNEEKRLHLEVSVRSPRAQHLADWVDALLAGKPDEAKANLNAIREFPVVLTRDLQSARQWLSARSAGDRRCGLLASSGARRLRAYGLELSSEFRHGFPYDRWFLDGPEDIRSSYQLEVAASQFECQGLEIDWAGVCWGGDLTYDPRRAAWHYRRFTGGSWTSVRRAEDQLFLLNRYRVLLTRARYGLVIWVPPGRATDPTIDQQKFDATATYLQSCGVPHLLTD